MNRDDLRDYKNNQECIKARVEHIQEFKAQLTNITSVITDMPKGSKKVNDNMAEKVAELVKLQDDYINAMLERDRKQKEILNQLDSVKQPYRLILDKIYIQGKNLVTVASEMKYDYKYICKQHGIALNEFERHDKSRKKRLNHDKEI